MLKIDRADLKQDEQRRRREQEKVLESKQKRKGQRYDPRLLRQHGIPGKQGSKHPKSSKSTPSKNRRR